MDDLNEHIRHSQIFSFSGKEWWLKLLLPRKFFIRYIANWMWDHGRRSFTLPDGTTWKILDRGVVESSRKPELS